MNHSREDILVMACEHKCAMECLAYRITNNWASAEDVFQDSLIVVGDRWKDFKPGTSIFAWLRRIVWYQSMDYVKTRKRKKLISFEMLQPVIEEEMSEWEGRENDHLNAKISALRNCMKEVPDRAKDLLAAYYSQGKSCKDIAEQRNWTLSNAKDSLYRLRNRLRGCIASKITNEQDDVVEHEELFESFCNGSLTEEESVALQDLLEEEPTVQEDLVRFSTEWAAFAYVASEKREALADSSDNNIVIEVGDFSAIDTDVRMSQPRKEGSSYVYLGGIAACFLIGIGLWIFISSSKSAPVAYLTAISGGVTYSDGESTARLSSSMERAMHVGDLLTASKGGFATIQLDGGASTIEIFEESVFQIVRSNSIGKSLLLKEGTLHADIGRQAEGIPLVFETPRAIITVLGTRFQLKASPNRTSIEMIEGRVKFRNRNTDEEIFVAEGSFAAISNNVFTSGRRKAPSSPSQILSSGFDNIDKILRSSSNEDHLIAWYHFDEGQGAHLNDSSSQGKAGVLAKMEPAASWGEGKFGKAVVFSAVDPTSRMRFHNFPVASLGKEMTLSFWFKPIEVNTVLYPISCWTSEEGAKSSFKGWRLAFNAPDNNLEFHVGGYHGNSGNQAFSDSENKLIMKEWNHIGFTYNNGHVRFYINGALAGEKTLATKELTYTDPPVRSIVVMRAAAGSSFNAGIDECMIFNKALSF